MVLLQNPKFSKILSSTSLDPKVQKQELSPEPGMTENCGSLIALKGDVTVSPEIQLVSGVSSEGKGLPRYKYSDFILLPFSFYILLGSPLAEYNEKLKNMKLLRNPALRQLLVDAGTCHKTSVCCREPLLNVLG